jgi:hypothetical protein
VAFTDAYLSDAEAARAVAAQGLEAATKAGDDAMSGQSIMSSGCWRTGSAGRKMGFTTARRR